MIYSTKLNTCSNFEHMTRVILVIFIILIILILFPIISSFSQKTDQPSQFGITFTSFTPHYFNDSDGYTVIMGEIENMKNFPITEVKILAGFYDDVNERPLETAIGTTINDVIPALGKSPYMIKSSTPNSSITNVSVNLIGFTSSSPKPEKLTIESKILSVGANIKISGTLTNNAPGVASQTKIHIAFHDPFQPPRIFGVSTIEFKDVIEGNSTIDFEFNEKFDARSSGYKVFAESSNHHSNVDTIEIVKPATLTKLVAINDISIKDDEGDKPSDIKAGSRVNVESRIWIQYYEDQKTDEQPYRYYVQVKQSEKAYVEFLGIYEGSFDTVGAQFPVVQWTPKNPGLYFIETFLWDTNAVPLASKGPVMLVLVA